MWNAFSTDTLGGMIAGASLMTGGGGDQIHTYIARPDGPGPYPGVVLIHHAPGWDEFYREFARRFAEHGYIAIVPNLFDRFGQGTPDDVAAAQRGAGGVTDDSVVADGEAALNWVLAHPTRMAKWASLERAREAGTRCWSPRACRDSAPLPTCGALASSLHRNS